MNKLLLALLLGLMVGCQPRTPQDPAKAQADAQKAAQDLQNESDLLRRDSLCIRAMSGDILAYGELTIRKWTCPIK